MILEERRWPVRWTGEITWKNASDTMQLENHAGTETDRPPYSHRTFTIIRKRIVVTILQSGRQRDSGRHITQNRRDPFPDRT